VNVREYTQVFQSRWRTVLLVMLACVALAGGFVFSTTPTYQASVQLFVSVQGGDSASDLQSGNSFTQSRVASYAKIAASPLVLQPVIVQLDLSQSPQSLAGQISASAPLNTVLINIAVKDVNPAEAARIANSVATEFTVAVASLERPTTGGPAPVRVTVTAPATVPTSPVSPKVARDLILGLILGLALGMGAALLRDTLDSTIRDDEHIKAVTDLPMIGGIVTDPAAASTPLVVQSNPHGVRAEAFRQLRTNLQFLNVSDRPRSIVITSSIPAEGKSTTTANLALTLAAAGSTVALVEGDLRRPRIADYLGLDNGAGLTNVLIGQSTLDEVLQSWGNGKLAVVACGPKPPNPSELLGSEVMAKVLGELTSRFDYVLVDAPPILPFTDAAILSKCVGGTILLIGSGRVKKEQVARSLETLAAVDARVVGVVANFLPTRVTGAHGYSYGYRYAETYSSESAGSHTFRKKGKSVEAPSVDTGWHELVDPPIEL
jgi:succinoglycan biosynthesis transport protein ExoP